MAGSRFYRIWIRVKERCDNPNIFAYTDYGGRGIKYLWSSFEEFRKDMYEEYQSHVKKFGENNTSIERINNNGNYCKENCKWATRIEQGRNKRNSRLVTFNGKNMSLFDWEKETKIPYKVIHSRIRDGWSIKRSLTTAVRHYPLI